MTGRWLPGRGAPIDFESIRRDLGIREDFPGEAQAEAEQAAANPPSGGRDASAIPFVTIDPPGSLDLDQAVHLERHEGGYRVHYAIADVARFVRSGGAVDVESRRRGQTYYSPDTRTPLHPLVLSEGAASLLPDQLRPAVLWTIMLDGDGAVTTAHVERAMVRSVAKLDYAGVQTDVERDTLHPSIALLPAVGRLRLAAARARHAISLDRPDAEIVRGSDGRWTLELRAILPVEKWNAEISLLTGMCAGEMMIKGRVGLLRTLPPPGPAAISRLRKATAAFGIPWPEDMPPGDVIATLDLSRPADAAFLEDAVRLLRGAGYTPIDGQLPKNSTHAGVGAVYAHVTAPLRRLADRFATEICLALQAGTPVPEWVLERPGRRGGGDGRIRPDRRSPRPRLHRCRRRFHPRRSGG